jgi:hypothetical protein
MKTSVWPDVQFNRRSHAGGSHSFNAQSRVATNMRKCRFHSQNAGFEISAPVNIGVKIFAWHGMSATIKPKIIDFCGPSANPGPFEPSNRQRFSIYLQQH